MNPAHPISGVAIYLLGHGPYRSPRPIELQFMRIDRYRGLLGSKYHSWKSTPDQLFVDINYPRAGAGVGQGAFPSFIQLLEAVQAGQINLVFFDVQEQVGFRHDYSWISYLLKQAGAQPINVFYDPDNVLREYLDQHFEGQAYESEITDASDFVAFYPTLSAEISLAALRGVRHHELCNKVTTAGQVWSTLYRLKELSPYASGRAPFIQEELEQEWYCRAQAKINELWAERRKHEILFRLGPSMPGLLLDESPYGGKIQARSPDELAWAEKRVLSELFFEKIEDEQNVSYVKNLVNHSVFADIRLKEKIAFYIYEFGEKVGRIGPSLKSFNLQDRYTRELPRRWQAELEKVVPLRDIQARINGQPD